MIRKLSLYISSLLLFLLAALPVSAQIYKYIGTSEGLSSRRVLAINKDSRGYMWILTHQGMDRFDGKNFTPYELRKDNKAISFFPDMNRITNSSNHDLWVYGKDGYVFQYDELQDTFKLDFDFYAQFPNLKQSPITATYFDSHDRIWFCCGNRIVRFYTDTQRFETVYEKVLNEITSITEGESSIFYFSTISDIYQVQFYPDKPSQVKRIYQDPKLRFSYLYYHPQTRQLLINTVQNSLFAYQVDKGIVLNLGNSLKDEGINVIKPYPSPGRQKVLIATDADGVYTLDMQTYRMEHLLQEDYESPNKMNGSIIKDLYVDEKHQIWNVTYPTGITIYSELYPAYTQLRHSPDRSNSLIDNRVNAILEDSEGDIWFATSNGISCYSTGRDLWTNYITADSKDTPNDNRIFISLCETTPGIIMVGGYMSGIYRINKKTHQVTFTPQMADSPRMMPDKYIRSLYKDKDGMFWMGGAYSFRKYDAETGQSEIYNAPYPITNITTYDEKRMWIGTTQGLYVFDKISRQLTAYADDNRMGGINTIYQTPDGRYTYLGTYSEGLFVIDNRTNQIENYNTQNSGLTSNNIYSIVPNRYGDIFMGTASCLSQLYVKKKEIINWTKEQGFPSNSFTQSAAIRTRSGKLILGSNEGAFILPDSLNLPEKFTSQMVFSNLTINYQPVHPDEKGSPLTRLINETQELTLDYDQNSFSMQVSSINYDNPSNIHYSWKLEGFFDTWSQPSANGTIRYTNLSPGTYTLKVRAILMDTHQVFQERELKIIVRPPFWQSYWAFALYILLAVGAVYLYNRYQMIRKDRRTSQEKINFFIHTAHDIRTPLTLIKAPLAEIQKSEQLTPEGMQNLTLALQSTDNLSNLANNLMNFQKEELYSSKVVVSRTHLNAYLDAYLQQFQTYADRKGVSLHFKPAPQEIEVWMDRNKIDSILRNLLSNALKYTLQGGTVSVEAGEHKGNWTLSISDTGIGIPQKDQKKLFKYLFRGTNATNQLITGSGIGMLLTYRLIRNHEGKISFHSTENVGTSFLLSFPIRSSRYQYEPEHPDTGTGTSEVTASVLHASAGQESVEDTDRSLPDNREDLPTILIVEDNIALQKFLCQSLSAHYRTVGAENGLIALEKMKTQVPDLILSDVMMPGMDGFELCGRVKSQMETSHIPFILLTALGDQSHIVSGLEIKADLYVVKPFDLVVLKAHIESLLQNRELLRRQYRQQVTSLPEEPVEVQLPTSLDDEFMQRVTQIIKEELGNDLTVDVLCGRMNMSRTSFYNKLKALTGIAPNDFIRNIRMQEAALLLKTRKYTVAEVSDRMGFADPKYFTDTFKKFYGMPPSTYMKQENNV